ncbi:septation protein A [Sphingosinithalassobacter sp. CS137]|uniref:septation protein A n=1 Tax=Sphingosinithalassobacter sp. CS137 TaxID=2762748 RepID=UPI00165DA30D|nr:septation protein A [Sphingosinithalassobacter sp. CS137]
MTPPTKNPASPGLRMLIDFGPLAVFFLVNSLYPGESQLDKVFAATAAFMIAMAGAMALSHWKSGHISPMLWVSGALVLVFGSLTLYFHNEVFIKVKPTIVYGMFAAVLAFGLATRRPLLKTLLEQAYPGLSERGWKLLTINWTIFFVVMAGLNELVWRTQSWDFWVGFKLWGVVPMTLIFAIANVPMLMKHGLQARPEEAPLPPEG